MKLPRMFRKSSTAGSAPAPQPKVFVVLDTNGAGRIVGVFDHEGPAMEILAVSPQYYRVFPLHLNEINPECMRWVQGEAGKEKLQRLSTQVRAIPEDEAG